MSRPDFYPHRPGQVTLVQTHISYVLLAGPEVYKVKKPVRFSFLDFSTLDRRRHFCGEEVRLNRRLAPDVYKGVVAICRRELPARRGPALAERDDPAAQLRLGPEDDPEAIEYAVHMRRLDDSRIMARLLEQRTVTADMVDKVAVRLGAFHHMARQGPDITANGDPAGIGAVLQDNFSGVARFRGLTITPGDDEAIQEFCTDFLYRNDDLLRRRQRQGRIRECHGDLHAEHICFEEPLAIFDCIEFNTQFRYCDVASDIAFLAMDLDYHDHPELARHLVDRYALHAEDPDLSQLVPFYQCYRAYVRGKVDSLKSAEEEVGDTEQDYARRSARAHFQLAYRYTWSRRPAMVLLTGLSGSGKSTIAVHLRERTGYEHINSDVVRKELFGIPAHARPPGVDEQALYSPEMSARTYASMMRRAEACLAAGRGVILDATFQRREHRSPARAIAARTGVPMLAVACACDEATVRERLLDRGRRGDSASDADWRVYLDQKARYEPITAGEDSGAIELDTSKSSFELTGAVEEALRARTA